MSAMVPDTDWGRASREFRRHQRRQVILCARCVVVNGDTTPPDQVVVSGGVSLCLDHFMEGR